MNHYQHPARLCSVEMDRQAYNAAFEELGLSWHWDSVTFSSLPAAGRHGVRSYIEREQPHLLRAYDAEFLVEAIENAKRRCYEVMVKNRVRAMLAPPSMHELLQAA